MNERRKFIHIDDLSAKRIQKLDYRTYDVWGNERVSHGLHLTEYEFNLLKEKGHLVLDNTFRSINVGVAKTILAQLLAKERKDS